MRILYVINDMGYGGAELQVLDIATELARRGHCVGVCVLVDYLALRDRFEVSGIRTFAVHMHYDRIRPSDLRRLADVYRDFRPDVVHSHLFGAIIASRFARLLVPLRALINTSHTPSERSRRRYVALAASEGLSDGWTNVCSEGVCSFLRARAVSSTNLGVVPNGIDFSGFAGRPERDVERRRQLGMSERFTWLSVGSFRDEQKDYGNLLSATATASASADFELWIAGEGPLRSEKQAYCEKLGIADRVRFLGLRDDVRTLMRCADGFVLASAWEALPIVLLEAAASWLPIVATGVGGNEQIAGDGRGRLVPKKSADVLAQAMLEVMSEPELERASRSRRARAHVEHEFSLASVGARWERIYRCLAADVPSRHGRRCFP